ncbi:hypothetical protein PIB30_012270 [Stylosanthes scabra]|uniref:Uncharacterized protein n=1 Tax=Stylosanthes scabra TaxID=79078 RepID=A0ABU6X4C7_9FABA|nr:hypothetical protein [Stylosanthes scabra]
MVCSIGVRTTSASDSGTAHHNARQKPHQTGLGELRRLTPRRNGMIDTLDPLNPPTEPNPIGQNQQIGPIQSLSPMPKRIRKPPA